ncbi:ribosomal L7Ae/L30e/S12e/Gadd45 family protein [Nicoliella spurrieriana]|uniref:Ribosomal L7Ae/L30e/S12e/Gadd45 family protein n=1 Tax=Nicoliella spurrieriana TaxID=2925830 RepID=A0A976X5E5_9LACO|nr:ribosomal L7Ae/L30e/S12e/Gadd45 family protein [Nicoliella spurrieriana]UQS86507.1 ribosomal L7Ae/L30e/S12e/Gadd45 family protein [Nicoliella spurrieriana]
MNNQKYLNLIGIAKRAGKVVTGEAIILNAIRKHHVALLIIASDTGQATTKKFIDKAGSYNVTYHHLITRQQLSDAIGAPRTMIGITDRGFAKKLTEIKNN